MVLVQVAPRSSLSGWWPPLVSAASAPCPSSKRHSPVVPAGMTARDRHPPILVEPAISWAFSIPSSSSRGFGRRISAGQPTTSAATKSIDPVNAVSDVAIEDGRISELGSHEALLAQEGRYAHLFRLQASGYLS